MKYSKTNSRLVKERLVSPDGELLGSVNSKVEGVEIGDYYKFMVTPENDKAIKYFGSNFAVFYYLLRHVAWPQGTVSTGIYIKQQIADVCEIKVDMVEAHFRNYIKLGLMKRVGQGMCMINPLRFFVGETHIQKQQAKNYYAEGWDK